MICGKTDRKKYQRENHNETEWITAAGLKIRPAVPSDLPEIMRIYQSAKQYMRDNGNYSQWTGGYPSEDLLRSDMETGQLFVIRKDAVPCAVFAFIIGKDPTYAVIEDGNWLSDREYGTIHRIASDGTQGGILHEAAEFCWNRIKHLRIDTHRDNLPMQRAILRNGFIRCGIIFLADGSPRIAFEKEGTEPEELSG